MCGCKIDNRETKLHHLPIHNSKPDLRFLHCYVAKEGGRIQSGHSLPLRFGSIACEITDSETLTCHVHARCYSAVFSATSLSTRVVKRTKRHNNGTILSQKKAGGSTAWASFLNGFVCETRIAKLPPVTCMRRCYSVQRWSWCLHAGVIRQSPAQLTWALCKCNARLTYGKCMCKNIKKKKKKRNAPGPNLTLNSFQHSRRVFNFSLCWHLKKS